MDSKPMTLADYEKPTPDFKELNPQKIAFVGDWHGDYRYASKVLNHLRNLNVDIVFQLGDFGFFKNGYGNMGMLSLAKPGGGLGEMKLAIIDGNHEDFDWLDEQAKNTAFDGTVHLARNTYYLPRGYRWEWDNISFVALGGAYSVDKDYRTPHVSWWEREWVNDKELERVINGGTADIMLTHDAPTVARIPFTQKFVWGEKNFILANKHREIIQQAYDAVQPKHLFHGHYHVRYDNTLPTGQMIHGLDMNKRPYDKHIMIFDVKDLKK